jgi:ABC-type thiamine transport system ATPase subunit
MNELDVRIVQALALKEQLKILEEELEIVKTEIKMIMNDKGIDKYSDSKGNQLSFKESSRQTLDRKLVEQKLAPEIFRECFKESRFETLTILSKEESERRKKFMEDKK